jgi:hypothetical protein
LSFIARFLDHKGCAKNGAAGQLQKAGDREKQGGDEQTASSFIPAHHGAALLGQEGADHDRLGCFADGAARNEADKCVIPMKGVARSRTDERKQGFYGAHADGRRGEKV